jgi:protease I
MGYDLTGKKVAILATDGFEQSELMEPLKALKDAKAEVKIVSLKSGQIKGWKDHNWGESVNVDATLDTARESDFDALVIPGGQINPDVLRADDKAVEFVRAFNRAKKPIAAICHGPWLLVESGVAKGLNVTSYKSIKTDLVNAGANWSDEQVVVDDGIITSRNPDDLPAFCSKLIEEVAEGRHMQRKAG